MPKCIGHNVRGEPCGRDAIAGGVVCQTHGGQAPKVKAKAAVRAEVMRWGLTDIAADPGEVLLRLVTQSARRADRYAEELERIVAEAPSLEEAFVGDSYAVVGEELQKVGEYLKGMAVLEAQERDRCANFAAKAVAAGLEERMVRLAEQQGALVADVLRKVFDDPDLGLTPEQRRSARKLAARHLRLAEAS